jgi:hypothetical protein
MMDVVQLYRRPARKEELISDLCLLEKLLDRGACVDPVFFNTETVERIVHCYSRIIREKEILYEKQQRISNDLESENKRLQRVIKEYLK